MKKKWLVILGSLILLFLPTVCMAGTINGNEQAVYSAACGTFTYEGKSYQAAPEYLSQLRGYLSRDDVDLTAEQASAAISQMYSSVAEGVANGYILPVGSDNGAGDGQGTSEEDEKPPEDDTPGDDPGVDAEPGDDGGKPANTNPGGGNGTPGNDGGAGNDGTSGNANAEPAGNESAASENGEAGNNSDDADTEDPQEDFKQYVEKYNAGIGKENTDILGNRPKEEEKASQVIHYDGAKDTAASDIQDVLAGKQLQIIKLAAIVSAVLFLIAGILLLIKKCFRFQKKASSAGHHTRKKIRKIARPLFAAAFGIGLSAIAVTGSMQAGLFKNDVVTSDLNDSGYYKESYEKLLEEVHQMLDEAGCMENTLDSVLSYEKFRFDSKNFLQAELSGNTKNSTFDTTKVEITDAVGGVAYFTEESKQELAENVIDRYKELADNGVGTVIYQIKAAFWQEAMPFLIIAIIAAALSLICPVLSEKNKYHIAYTAGAGLIITGVISFIAYIIFSVKDILADVYVEPDYLYLFLYRYLTDSGQLYLIPAIGAAIVGVICFFAGKKMRSQ